MADGFITLQTEDGLVIENVPSNLADPQNQQYSQEIRDYVADLRSKGQTGTFQYQAIETQPITQQPEVIQQPQQVTQPQKQTILEDLAGGTGATLRGAIPLLTAEMVTTPIVDTVNRLLGTNIQRPAEAMSELFTRIGIEEPDTEAEKLVQAMSEGAIGAMTSIGAGGLLQAGKGLGQTVAKGVGGVLAGQPAGQIAGGVAGEAGGEIARQAGASPAVQFGASVLGDVAGGGLANIGFEDVPIKPIQEATERGVRVLTSDVRPPKKRFGKVVQDIQEQLPFVGTGGLRSAQEGERIQAITELVQEFDADSLVNNSEAAYKMYEGLVQDVLTKRKSKLAQYVDDKTEVIGRLSTSDVPMNKTIASLNKEISLLEGTPETQPLINKLKEWKDSFEMKAVSPNLRQRIAGQKPTSEGRTLNEIERMRRIFGQSYKSPELGSIPTESEKVIRRVYDVIKEDMGDYIKDVGEPKDFTKWNIANKRLSKMTKELNDRSLKKILNKGEAKPEEIRSAILNKERSEMMTLYKHLTPKGKASVRSVVLGDVAEKSFTGEKISPLKFTARLKKEADKKGVFFTNKDLEQINGLVRVLETTQRASQSVGIPQTGVRTLIPASTATIAALIPGTGLERILGTAAVGTGMGLSARAYESKAVRDILTKIPRVKAGSPQEGELIRRLNEIVRTIDVEGDNNAISN